MNFKERAHVKCWNIVVKAVFFMKRKVFKNLTANSYYLSHNFMNTVTNPLKITHLKFLFLPTPSKPIKHSRLTEIQLLPPFLISLFQSKQPYFLENIPQIDKTQQHKGIWRKKQPLPHQSNSQQLTILTQMNILTSLPQYLLILAPLYLHNVIDADNILISKQILQAANNIDRCWSW